MSNRAGEGAVSRKRSRGREFSRSREPSRGRESSGRSLENPLDPTPAWPQRKAPLNTQNRDFPNSTAFFKWVVTAGVMSVDFAFFSAPGMDAEKSQNPARFDETKNAWAVTVAVNNEMKDDVPVLFTANISQHAEHLTPLRSLSDVPYLARDGIPFGNKGGVVVLNGISTMK